MSRPALVTSRKKLMTETPFRLDDAGDRVAVRLAVVEVCRERGWRLLALHVCAWVGAGGVSHARACDGGLESLREPGVKVASARASGVLDPGRGCEFSARVRG